MVTAYKDRKDLIRYINNYSIKPIQYAQDCGAIKSRYNEIKKKLSIEIVLKYATDEIEANVLFERNRGGHLIYECNIKAKLL